MSSNPGNKVITLSIMRSIPEKGIPGLKRLVQSKMSVRDRNAPHFAAIEYCTLQDAYSHFNAVLFDGVLPRS